MGFLQNKDKQKTLAHILPFVLFMVFVELPKLFKIDNEALPWYRYSPELWIYPIQIVLCAVVLGYFWKHYRFNAFVGSVLAVLLGILGIVMWILPSKLYEMWGLADIEQIKLSLPLLLDEQPILSLFGLTERLEGFDPSFLESNQLAYGSAVLMRFTRMVVIVPLIEEIFWRGFVMRYAINPDKPWSVKFGTHHWKAWFFSTLFFTLVHHPIDWLACVVFGSLAYWLAVKTKSLWACVLMHAVANLILGLYTMYTQQWGFW